MQTLTMRVMLTLIFPFILLSVLVDVLLGDLVCGFKTNTTVKINEHKTVFLKLWRNK